jgi:hypothetical protein
VRDNFAGVLRAPRYPLKPKPERSSGVMTAWLIMAGIYAVIAAIALIITGIFLDHGDLSWP